MRTVARYFGFTLMTASTALLLWLSFTNPFLSEDHDLPVLARLFGAVADSEMGLKFPAMLLIGFGYLLWRWGKGERLSG